MLPDRVSNPGPLTYESGALPIALRGPALRQTDRRTEGRHDMIRPVFDRRKKKHFIKGCNIVILTKCEITQRKLYPLPKLCHLNLNTITS